MTSRRRKGVGAKARGGHVHHWGAGQWWHDEHVSLFIKMCQCGGYLIADEFIHVDALTRGTGGGGRGNERTREREVGIACASHGFDGGCVWDHRMSYSMTPKPTPYRMTPDEKRIVRYLTEKMDYLTKTGHFHDQFCDGWKHAICQIERGWHRPTPGRTT